MLKELYDYAVRHDLTLPEGYVRKTVKAYISLSSEASNYVGVRLADEDETLAYPDIGSLANSTDKSNVIIEKRSVVIPSIPTAKSSFFQNALANCGENDSVIRLCAEALQHKETVVQINAELDRLKVKSADRISFMVDGRPIVLRDSVLEWWKVFRKQFAPDDGTAKAPCLITGELTIPMKTAPKITGLRAVGGHSSGDALICFDKAAFTSYGLDQAANAPVSEFAMSAVKAALDNLLQHAPRISGVKFVHWYDDEIEETDDPIAMIGFSGFFNDEDDDGEEEQTGGPAELIQAERDAEATADRLIKSVRNGEQVRALNANYYILMLSGVGGRVMVRRYERGRYEDLQKNITLWNSDLDLVNAHGEDLLKPCKLTARLIRLLKFQKTNKEVMKRLDGELSGITPAVLMAIVNGTTLPDVVAVRALAYIRSKILSGEDGDRSASDNGSLDGRACQWLKVWLIRRNREKYDGREEILMNDYNMNHPEEAYHCGAIMAVYAAIQKEGYRDVNVSVVERYYASAIQSPALVFGQLSRLSVHHLEKIQYKSIAELYRARLSELYVAIGVKIPVTLNLEKQAYFALGYYQMTAKLNSEKRVRLETKNIKTQTANESEE